MPMFDIELDKNMEPPWTPESSSPWLKKRNCSINDSVPNYDYIQSPMKSLMVFVRFLGIELDPSFMDCKCHRFLFITYGLVLLITNVFCNVYTIVVFAPRSEANLTANHLLILKDKNITEIKTSTFTWSTILDYASFGMLAFGIHGAILFTSNQLKWKILWNSVQKLWQCNGVFNATGKSIRRITYAGLVFIFIVIMLLSV